MEIQRPSPDSLLRQIHEEEKKALTGRLKIYLGASPGVGKTHSMLQDALAKRAQGLDVLIGVVESHGRIEIDVMRQELESIPLQKVLYREKTLYELDLDAVLKRQPALILIDELAHTNAPGVRHLKRWQDVKEILDRGIDVYTTLNIQHIESLNGMVSQILHTQVKETVPDSLLDMADTIELIDLPPEELIKRLQEGKIYFPAQAEMAKEHFFRESNLTALRELALQATADRVHAQVYLYHQERERQQIWSSQEKLLVCVGKDQKSLRVIRSARRMASNLQVGWIAVHVDVPTITKSEADRNKAIQYLHLAEQLGAETHLLTGIDIVKTIIDFAREQNITTIVIGRRNRPWWRDLAYNNLALQMIRHSREMNVHVVNNHDPLLMKEKTDIAPKKIKVQWKEYVIAFLVVSFFTGINFFLNAYLNTNVIIIVYLFAVILIALRGNIGPALCATLYSLIVFNYYFSPPISMRGLSEIENILTMTVMMSVAYTISHLTILNKRQTEIARFAEKRTSALHHLSRKLSNTRGVDKLCDIGFDYLGPLLESDVCGLLAQDGRLMTYGYRNKTIALNEKELGVARWVYDMGQMAGLGTDTLPFSEALYMPLIASQGIVGVLRVQPLQSRRLFSPEQIQLLEACSNQLALAIEVDRLYVSLLLK